MAKAALLVAMTAIAFGTRCGPSGNILHTDPDGTDPKAVNPHVSEEDADFLEAAGLAERSKKAAKPAAAAPTVAAPAAKPVGNFAKGAKGAAADGGKAAKPAAAAPEAAPAVDASGIEDTDADVPPAS